MLHFFQWETKKSPPFKTILCFSLIPVCSVLAGIINMYGARLWVQFIPLVLKTPNHWPQNSVNLSWLMRLQYRLNTKCPPVIQTLDDILILLFTIHTSKWLNSLYVTSSSLSLWEHSSPVPCFLSVLSAGACSASLLSCESAAQYVPFREGWWSVL